MTPFSIVHDFDGEPAAYWRVFFDETYNQELYRRIRVKERRILAWKEDEAAGTIYREIRIYPERDLPGFLQKIVRGDLGYVEKSTWYRDRNHLDVVVEPTLLSDKTTIEADYDLVVLAPGRLRRTFAGTMDVRIPLLGKKIEEFIIAEMTRTYEIAAEVTREWLAKT